MGRRTRGRKSLPQGLHRRTRQGRDYYLVQVVVDGRRKGRAIGFVDRAEALRQYPVVLAELQREKPQSPSPTGTISFSLFLETYYLPMLEDSGLSAKTVQCERTNAGHLIAFFGTSRELTSITTAAVEDFKRWRRGHGGWTYRNKRGEVTRKLRIRPRARTINLDLRVIRKAFRYAKRLGFIEHPPEVINLPEKAERKPRRYLTREEMEKVIDAGEGHRLLLLTAFHTGMRKGEILSRTWDDIDVERGEIRVCDRPPFRCKKNSQRVVPMTEQLRDAFAAVPESERQGGVFSLRYMRSAVIRACRRAGVREINPHATRHTFATLAAADGMERGALRAVLGHCDSKMLDEIYQHVMPDHVQAQMGLLSWGRAADPSNVIPMRQARG